MEEIPKIKRVLSPEHLEKLKLSREKALEARRKNKNENLLKKELKTIEHDLEIDAVKTKIKKLKEPIPSSESEPEPVVVKKKKKKIIVVEQSDSDDQQQVIYVKRKEKEKEKESITQQIEIPQVPVVIQAPPVNQRKQYIDPTAIYNSFYQRGINR